LVVEAAERDIGIKICKLVQPDTKTEVPPFGTFGTGNCEDESGAPKIEARL